VGRVVLGNLPPTSDFVRNHFDSAQRRPTDYVGPFDRLRASKSELPLRQAYFVRQRTSKAEASTDEASTSSQAAPRWGYPFVFVTFGAWLGVGEDGCCRSHPTGTRVSDTP
jgi:hypothetical protein